MVGALRVVSVQRGLDPRDFALVAFGGAGPLHANALAELLGCYPVLVPPNPGVLCALGFLEADFRNEFAQTYIRSSRRLDSGRRGRASTTSEAAPTLAGRTEEGIAEGDQKISYVADMRYHLQGYEIPVPVDLDAVKRGDVASLGSRFDDLHEQLYGFRMPDTDQEIVSLRTIGNGSVPKIALPTGEAAGTDASGAIVDEHAVVYKGEPRATKIYDRGKLRPGNRFDGPAIVTEFDSTTVVLPGYTAEVDTYFNILINPAKA